MGEPAGRMFDWYAGHPELIRLLLWEALEAGAEPGEGEGERRDGFRAKAQQLADGGVASHLPAGARVRAAQDLLFTLMGLIAWNFAVPGTCRLALGEETSQAAFARGWQTVIEAARTLTETASSPGR